MSSNSIYTLSKLCKFIRIVNKSISFFYVSHNYYIYIYIYLYPLMRINRTRGSNSYFMHCLIYVTNTQPEYK